MISYSQALQVIQDAALAGKLASEVVPLEATVGRTSAKSLSAPLDIQPFDNSAMDGFAVRLVDLANACVENPVTLRKAGVLGAGQLTEASFVEAGTCWHIMTGAILPQGAEAVIPIENVVIEAGMVTFHTAAVAGQNIRRRGEDFTNGAAVLSAGDKIMPAHIMPLATLGVGEVEVFKRPRVLFIPTGMEIIADLSSTLAPGQIYDSNRFYAISFLRACGAEVVVADVVKDDVAHFLQMLAEAQKKNYDLIISSGAVSAGSFDFVAEGLKKHGAKVLYHKISLKPGKPNLLAVLPGGGLYFGLPGNPVATAVGLRFFVKEALRVLNRQKPEQPVYAHVMNGFKSKKGMHMVLKGLLEYWEDGSVTVDILDGQESFKVSPFLKMNCWIHVNESAEALKSGDIVEAYPLMP
jgi:molybdopterin molybdotransferase